MKKIDGPIKKPGKKSGLGFLNLVNEAYKEQEKENPQIDKKEKKNPQIDKKEKKKEQGEKKKEELEKKMEEIDRRKKELEKKRGEQKVKNEQQQKIKNEQQQKTKNEQQQKTKNEQQQKQQQGQKMEGNIMLTELVDEDQIEEYNLQRYKEMEMSVEKLEKILDDIHKKQRQSLKEKSIKKAEQYVKNKTEQVEQQLYDGRLEINEEVEYIQVREEREEQQKRDNLQRLQLRLREYNQKRHEMEGQMHELDVEMQYLENQNSLQMYQVSKRQRNELSPESKEVLRQRVIQLEAKRKKLQKKREQQYQDFVEKVKEEKEQNRQLDLEEKEYNMLLRQENAYKGIERINERARERGELLGRFKKDELKVKKSLLEEHKERLKKVRDMRGQRVPIEEIREHEQKQLKLEKEYEEQRNKKIQEIKELKKLPVYESHFYKEKHNEYIDELYMEERRQKWKRDKLQQLANEIKQKHPPQVDQRKKEQFRLMTDVDEVQKKNKRRKKVVRDKKTHEVLEKSYAVPQEVDLEKYQSELYKKGKQNLDYVKQLKKKRKRNLSGSDNDVSEEKENIEGSVLKTNQSERVVPVNYMMDKKVRNKLAHSSRLDEIMQIKDPEKRYEMMLDEMNKMDQQVQRQEMVSKSLCSAQFHGTFKRKQPNVNYSIQEDESQQPVEDAYVRNIKAKLNFVNKS